MRRIAVLFFAVPTLLASCSDAAVPPVASGQGGAADTVAEGVFQPGGRTAITYDPQVVPAGASAQVTLGQTTQGATVRLAVAGLAPDRAYGAHLHTKPCAATGDAAGPHYQHRADPETPSVDPSYANPANEVWLDLTTDARGAATAASDQAWAFDGTRPPRSLIVHAGRTRTTAGVAGTAGPRVACLTLPAAPPGAQPAAQPGRS